MAELTDNYTYRKCTAARQYSIDCEAGSVLISTRGISNK
jgi:hypothetical protein